MEDWQKRHITLAQLTLTNMIATKIWLIGEIENKSNLTHEEKGDYMTLSSSTDRMNYLIDVLKTRSQGYKIFLTTLLQNLFTEGLLVFQDTFLPSLLQDMKIGISGNVLDLNDIFSSKHIEKLCIFMKTKVRVTEFTRLVMKLTGDRTILLCVEDSGNDNEEEISIKVEMITALLKINSNLIHKKDSYGRTSLLAKRCHLDLIKYLVKEGVDIYLTDDDGYTLVHIAAGWMSPDIFHELVRFLLMDCKAGERFEWKDNMGNTSLHFALSYLSRMRADTVQLILKETKINVNGTNRYGENLLYRAFLGGQNTEVLKLLINHGADKNTKNHHFCNDFGGWGNAEAFLYFLRLGINVLE